MLRKEHPEFVSVIIQSCLRQVFSQRVVTEFVRKSRLQGLGNNGMEAEERVPSRDALPSIIPKLNEDPMLTLVRRTSGSAGSAEFTTRYRDVRPHHCCGHRHSMLTGRWLYT